MKEVTKQRLISAWIAMHLAEMDSEKYKSYFWAYEVLWEYCHKRPQFAFDVILGLIEASPNEHILGMVAAGPFEDLMCAHGVEVLPKIKELLATKPKLITAMQWVWLDSKDTPVWNEFYELAGIEPPFPEEDD